MVSMAHQNMMRKEISTLSMVTICKKVISL